MSSSIEALNNAIREAESYHDEVFIEVEMDRVVEGPVPCAYCGGPTHVEKLKRSLYWGKILVTGMVPSHVCDGSDLAIVDPIGQADFLSRFVDIVYENPDQGTTILMDACTRERDKALARLTEFGLDNR